MSNTTELRIGAQQEAAHAIREKQAEFTRLIQGVLTEQQALGNAYRGQAASALAKLVGDWAEDASRLVREFEAFAQRMVDTDRNATQSQDDAAGDLHKVSRPIRTSI